MIQLNQELNLDLSVVNYCEKVLTHTNNFDFNVFFNILDRNEENFFQKKDHSFKLTNFQNTHQGQQYQETVKSMFDYQQQNIDTYVFASFSKLGITPNHSDTMTVFLIPTYGEVVYSVYSETEQNYFLLKKGDLLTIPKGIIHSAIPLNPRIVVSVGVYN